MPIFRYSHEGDGGPKRTEKELKPGGGEQREKRIAFVLPDFSKLEVDSEKAEAMFGLIKPGVRLVDLVNMFPGEDLRGFVFELLSVWQADKKGEVEKLLREPLTQDVELMEIPFDGVSLGGRNVRIHGVIHGHGFAGRGHVNPDFVAEIRGYVTRTAGKGDKWYTEQSLAGDFGIKGQVTELSEDDAWDIEGIMEKVEREHPSKLPIFQKIIALGVLGYEYLKGGLASTYIGNNALYGQFKELVNKFNNDQRYIYNIQRFHDIVCLPEPLDMEVAMVLSGKNPRDRYANLIVDRSLAQAEEISKAVRRQRNKKTVYHVLVGDMHRRIVRYLLENPGYDPIKSIEEIGLGK